MINLKQKVFGIIFIALVSSACATRGQGTQHYLVKYQQAEARYAAKDYYEALQLYREAIPLLRGKKEIVTAHLHQAYAYFYQKKYRESAQCFKHFYKIYPRIPQAEEALYMEGHALYLAIPDVELDQHNTVDAIQTFNQYLNQYPQGHYKQEVVDQLHVLNNQMAHKALLNAKLYEQLGHYQAAVIALTNFQQSFPHSNYQEEAAYVKVQAAYKLAKANKKEIQHTKWRDAMLVCQYFLDHYSTSEYKKAVEGIYEDILKQINQPINHKN